MLKCSAQVVGFLAHWQLKAMKAMKARNAKRVTKAQKAMKAMRKAVYKKVAKVTKAMKVYKRVKAMKAKKAMKEVTKPMKMATKPPTLPAFKYYEKYWCMLHQGKYYNWTCKIAIKNNCLFETWTGTRRSLSVMQTMNAMKAMKVKK